MININAHRLREMDWDTIARPLSMRTKDNEEIRYLNMVLNENTGEVLEVAHRVTVVKDMLVLHIALKKTIGESSFKIVLLDKKSELPDSIVDVITSTFEEFNSGS